MAGSSQTLWISLTGLLCSIFFIAGQWTAGSVSATAFIDLVKARRTYYALNENLPVAKEEIQHAVEELIQAVPSAFNSQSNRAVVLFGQEHNNLWDTIGSTLKTMTPEDQWKAASDRLAMFKAGAGTVLFFVDETVVKEFQTNIPAYADYFPVWADHSDGMLQHSAWTALEAQGLGANLQHYNFVNEKIAKQYDLPSSWRLNAQLVFGGRSGEPGEKTTKPLGEKLKVFGA